MYNCTHNYFLSLEAKIIHQFSYTSNKIMKMVKYIICLL